MTRFTVEITDPAALAGIAAAREARNAALAQRKSDGGDDTPIAAHPEYLASDADYVQFVIAGAAASYARQFGLTAEEIEKAEADLANKKARLADMGRPPLSNRV
jgi:hypothetical protein